MSWRELWILCLRKKVEAVLTKSFPAHQTITGLKENQSDLFTTIRPTRLTRIISCMCKHIQLQHTHRLHPSGVDARVNVQYSVLQLKDSSIEF